MPPSASSQSERTPRQAEEPHRRRLWLSTRATTTGEDRTARSSSSHPGPITPWPIFQERIKRRPVLGGLLNEYGGAA